jgi:autotransporter family porin
MLSKPARKVIFILMSILLLIAIVLLSITITHRPLAAWKIIASFYDRPPTAASISGEFTTLAPGSALPSEQECAARVHRSVWEPRQDNSTANYSVPTAQQIVQLSSWGTAIGVDPKADALRKQITGNFTGTTNEIIQWVACKWGIDENIVRAEAVVESYWHQSQQGDYINNRADCPPGTWDGSGCYQSYGILQLKYAVFPSVWPMSRDDTAFNAEYVYAVIRTCYEGWTTYLSDLTPVTGYPSYHAGDIWGCLGRWYSGGWYNQGAIDYINKVKSQLTNKDWLQAGF